MLLLFETAAGFALFKVNKEDKLEKAEDLYKDFATLEGAQKVVKLKAFSKFDNTTEALAAATALVESKLSKETLAVLDSKLGNLIKEKLQISCVYRSAGPPGRGMCRDQLLRSVYMCMYAVGGRLHVGVGIELGGTDLTPMSLGLSHSLSRYKLKFSPEKVDTMIVQMTKIVSDNIAYAKAIKAMGTRDRAASIDFSGVLEQEVEDALKAAAQISMGTEISLEDLDNIMALADQVGGAMSHVVMSHGVQQLQAQAAAVRLLNICFQPPTALRYHPPTQATSSLSL
eukprot:gene9707-9866_t